MATHVEMMIFFTTVIALLLAGAGMFYLKVTGKLYEDVMSNEETGDHPKESVVASQTTTTTTPVAPVATQQNLDNDLLLKAKVEALAALIMESKRHSFQNGIVPETRAIGAIFGERAGSTNARYQYIRSLLKEELERRKVPDKPVFRELTADQRLLRAELGLE